MTPTNVPAARLEVMTDPKQKARRIVAKKLSELLPEDVFYPSYTASPESPFVVSIFHDWEVIDINLEDWAEAIVDALDERKGAR